MRLPQNNQKCEIVPNLILNCLKCATVSQVWPFWAKSLLCVCFARWGDFLPAGGLQNCTFLFSLFCGDNLHSRLAAPEIEHALRAVDLRRTAQFSYHSTFLVLVSRWYRCRCIIVVGIVVGFTARPFPMHRGSSPKTVNSSPTIGWY